jgi:hypothetical protein
MEEVPTAPYPTSNLQLPLMCHPNCLMQCRPRKGHLQRFNKNCALASPVIELQRILLQWILFKKMKNMLKLSRNIHHKLDILSHTTNSHYFNKYEHTLLRIKALLNVFILMLRTYEHGTYI